VVRFIAQALQYKEHGRRFPLNRKLGGSQSLWRTQNLILCAKFKENCLSGYDQELKFLVLILWQ
jgi:hypothetical protein